MCRDIREAITASPMLTEMIERGRLKVLALYPDEDLTEWRNYRSQIPATWINAYDAGCKIRKTTSTTSERFRRFICWIAPNECW